jgi:SOS-response transcriptional repressor LexA
MDSVWLKKRLRQLGKTTLDLAEAIQRDRAVVSRIINGHQQLNVEQAKAFAAVLEVDVGEIMLRAGQLEGTAAANVTVRARGFSEGDAAAWIPAPNERHNQELGEALGARPGVDIWQMKTEALVLAGYLPGDFLLVDTHSAEKAQSGDVVVAQVYDAAGGARTVVRKYRPPVLVSACTPTKEDRVYVVDNENVLIRGKVVAQWRTMPK